jgi:hypothetical protein
MPTPEEQPLTADEQFFFDNAGWSHDPLTESPREGRARCARELAAAEEWARDNGYTVEWEGDWQVRSHIAEYRYDAEPETCEMALLFPPDDGESVCVASRGCVDNAEPENRRVVAAELALEVMHNA